jgi:peptidoglycan/LPS O-acetylase OafA/YrhL
VPFSKFSISISFALCLVCIVSKNFGFLHALLNSRVMCWIGSLSYSAYLWQQLVLRPGGIAEIFPMLSFADNSFISILNIIIFASVSYYLVEKPLLRMRSKLH